MDPDELDPALLTLAQRKAFFEAKAAQLASSAFVKNDKPTTLGSPLYRRGTGSSLKKASTWANESYRLSNPFRDSATFDQLSPSNLPASSPPSVDPAQEESDHTIDQHRLSFAERVKLFQDVAGSPPSPLSPTSPTGLTNLPSARRQSWSKNRTSSAYAHSAQPPPIPVKPKSISGGNSAPMSNRNSAVPDAHAISSPRDSIYQESRFSDPFADTPPDQSSLGSVSDRISRLMVASDSAGQWSPKDPFIALNTSRVEESAPTRTSSRPLSILTTSSSYSSTQFGDFSASARPNAQSISHDRMVSHSRLAPPRTFVPDHIRRSTSAPDTNSATADMSKTSILSPSPSFNLPIIVAQEESFDYDESKKRHIINELVETERTFLSDLLVLQELYVIPGARLTIFTPQDNKILFSNLDSVIALAGEMVHTLEGASDSGLIGKAFLLMMPKIEQVYCDYCKHNDAAIAKVAEYSTPAAATSPSPSRPSTPTKTLSPAEVKIRAFLKETHAKLAGRTTAWDLGSLIIKPVQRVLKYPLLLKQLLKETPSAANRSTLDSAYRLMEAVAEKINQVKKQKDIVERYVEGKAPLNVVHGITKKVTRGTQQLKQVTGLAEKSAEDERYNKLESRVEAIHKTISILIKDTTAWTRELRSMLDHNQLVAQAIESIFQFGLSNDQTAASSSNGSSNIAKVMRWSKSIEIWPALHQEIDLMIKQRVIVRAESIISLFREPMKIMRKREAKLLDFNRVHELQLKNDKVDKALLESADAYTSINAQLVEELPKFTSFILQLLDIVYAEIADIQIYLYLTLRDASTAIIPPPAFVANTVRYDYVMASEANTPMEASSRDIKILSKWRAGIWGASVVDEESAKAAALLAEETRRTLLMSKRQSLSPTLMADSVAGFNLNHIPPKEIGIDAVSESSHEDFMTSRLSPGAHGDVNFDSVVNDSFVLSKRAITPQEEREEQLHEEENTVVAMYAFTAEVEDEISLLVGDHVLVSMRGGRYGLPSAGATNEEEDWWYGLNLRDWSRGWFPQNHTAFLLALGSSSYLQGMS